MKLWNLIVITTFLYSDQQFVRLRKNIVFETESNMV